MADHKQSRNSEAPAHNFGIEDCEALLEFPYHDYANDVKTEINSESSHATNTNFLSYKQKRESFLDSQVSLPQQVPLPQEECLSLNQVLQKKIQETIKVLDSALQKNLTKQDELIEANKEIEKNAVHDKVMHAKPISLFASPYFRDTRGMVPPDNVDTIEKTKRKDVTSYLIPPKPWTRLEKDHLMEGVAASALNVAIKPYKMKRDHLKTKLKDKGLLEFELDVIKKQLLHLEKKIKVQSQRPLTELLEECGGCFDWMTISATNLQGTKSEEECEIMWNNYLSNTVNKEHFTSDEDQKLRTLVQKYGGRNWDAIAEDLQTNRTAIQCLERYQTYLNPDLTKKYWTPEEDAQLLGIVETLKIGNYIPWNKVCCYMEGRTRHQILNRYERTISKDIKRTPFSVEEDAMLMACYYKFGLRWIKMKPFLPGRPTYTIRERFVNTLDPTIRIGNWSRKEDIKLIELLKKYGYGRWAKISREMHGRTDNMCLVRTKRLEIFSKRMHHSKKNMDLDEKCGGLVLRPAAPSKNCYNQNKRLKRIQMSSEIALQTAIKKISPFIDDTIDLDSLDLSEISMSTLHALRKELIRMESRDDSAEKWTPHYVPPRFQKIDTRRKNRQIDVDVDYVSSECDEKMEISADEEDYFIETKLNNASDEDSLVLSVTEKHWLFEVLHQRLKEEAFLVRSNMKTNAISLTARESAECSFYRSYLRQKMFCREIPEEEEDYLDKSTCSSYKTALSNVVKYFIQPDPEDEQPIVLCPNFATMNAMEIFEVTKTRLRRTAGFIDNSKSYLQYLVGQKEEKPKCSKCKVNKNATPEFLNEVLRSMQRRLLVIDEKFYRAAQSEIGYPPEECKCRQLQDSRESFNLLQKRFMSLFLWPFLLSATDLSKEQGEVLGQNVAHNYMVEKNKVKSVPEVKKKLGRPKSMKPKIIMELKVKGKPGRPGVVKGEIEPSAKKVCLEKTEEPSLVIPETPDYRETNDMNVQSKKSPKKKQKPIVDTQNLRRSRRSCVLERKSYCES